MAALRFHQGDLAVLVIAGGPASQRDLGKVGTVECIGPFNEHAEIHWRGRICDVADAADYVWACASAAKSGVMVMDWQLRKINPPEEPESLHRVKDVGVLA